jgi:hypothetical protein
MFRLLFVYRMEVFVGLRGVGNDPSLLLQETYLITGIGFTSMSRVESEPCTSDAALQDSAYANLHGN